MTLYIIILVQKGMAQKLYMYSDVTCIHVCVPSVNVRGNYKNPSDI